jgi:hypothetical protein
MGREKQQEVLLFYYNVKIENRISKEQPLRQVKKAIDPLITS